MSKKTPIYDSHVALGAKIVDFHGWQLPIQYEGVIAEHNACRKQAALFDTSHMGEFWVEGPQSIEFLNYICSNDVARTDDGKAMYSVICNEQGGIIDDLILYRFSEQKFLIVINASNTEKDFVHFSKVAKDFNVKVKNVSDEFCQIAIQGSKAEQILNPHCSFDLAQMKYFRFAECKIFDQWNAIVSRTGYTGEDGFEIYVDWKSGKDVWDKVIVAGREHGLKPCGLAARDTLRLEARLPLHGNDIDENTSPLEAGLGWVVKWKKPDFIGKKTLEQQMKTGVTRQLVGIELTERGIPRPGYSVFSTANEEIGKITSGTHSPTLQKAIALTYVPSDFSSIGTPLYIDIRGKKLAARVSETPFYKRERMK